MVSKWKASRRCGPAIETASGRSRGAPPIHPATAARRSWVTTPTSRPRTPSLNETEVLGTTVVISAVDIGIRTSPDWKKGWPNSSTRSPSRQVTVPIAESWRSPRMTSTATAEPGARLSGPGPPPAERPPGTAVSPRGASQRAASSRAAGFKPPQASGSASGDGPAVSPGAGVSGAAAAPSQQSSRKRGEPAAAGRSIPVGPAVPGPTFEVGRSSTSSISRIGVTPNVGSREKLQPLDKAPTSRPST